MFRTSRLVVSGTHNSGLLQQSLGQEALEMLAVLHLSHLGIFGFKAKALGSDAPR